jgi:predicted RND superfamily exporter protein
MVILFVLLIPLGLWAVFHLPMGSAGVHDWLPEGKPERIRYEKFVADFGNDQVVLISWDGCQLEDPRLVEFQKQLQSSPEFATHFSVLESTDQLMASLTAAPLQLSAAVAKARLNGVMIGKDGTSAVLARVSDQGVADQNRTIALIRIAADQTDGLGRSRLRLAGTVYEAFAVDEAAENSLKKLVLPSSFLGLLVAWFCLKQLKRAIIVLVIAGVGQLLSVALVYYSGYRFSAVLIVLPTLVFMLTLSGAVHLMNYHAECLKQGLDYAGERAMLMGWKPCALSSVTTMLGMGSLCTSQLAPVRQFGIFSAIGLGIATLVLLLGFPALVNQFCSACQNPLKTKDLRPQADQDTSPSRNWLGRYSNWLFEQCNSISFVGIALLVLTCAGLYYLKASTKFTDMFPDNSKTNQDMAWMEEHIGPIATVEVLVRFSPESQANALDRAGWIAKISDAIKLRGDVGGVLSAATFLPVWSETGSVRATAKRALIRKGIEESIPKLQQQGLVASSEAGEVWRILAKVSATSQVDYAALTRSVATATHLTLQNSPPSHNISVEFTGLSPVMHETQVAVLSDLGYSFLTAFLLITPVMMLIAKSFAGGLLLMIPNVLPVTIAFGCMGIFGLDLDIAGILTASIALGIAVDDTLHFVCWYVDELKKGISRAEAVTFTLDQCGGAMIQTTLISCCSMGPFLLAEFLPTQQFAKLMIVMLSWAIVGDLVLLPALLLCPLGLALKPAKERP